MSFDHTAQQHVLHTLKAKTSIVRRNYVNSKWDKYISGHYTSTEAETKRKDEVQI